MNRWDRYWYAPVAAVRPYLLIKSVLAVFALDICVLMLPRGHWYGHADFNVAHFRWLDALQPLPTQASYNCVLLLAGMLALVGVLCSANRSILVLVLLLYTYSWSMSLHDGFQHHYFISLVLLCMALLPNIRTDALSPSVDTSRSESMETAWSFRLLGVTIGIVYGYAVVAKLDPTWFSGDTLQQFVQPGKLQPILRTFAFCGFSEQTFYRILAVGTILIELVLAVGYLIATDSPKRNRYRYLYLGLWILAVVFHLGIEITGIQNIGWFSCYMILLATVFFLPSEWLILPATIFVRLARGFERASAWFVTDDSKPAIGIILLVLLVATGLVAEGRYLDLPGATYAFTLSALLMVAYATNSLLRANRRAALLYLLAWGAAGGVVLSAVLWTTVRFDYYLQLGHDYRHLGQWTAATNSYQKALVYAGSDRVNAAATQLHLGRLHWSAGQPEQAIDHFQSAIRFRPGYPEAHYNLGMALQRSRQTGEAIEHFQQVLKYRPDWIPALNQTARILATVPDAKLKNPGMAIELANRAARLSGGQNVDILITLIIAYQSAGRHQMALTVGKQAVALARRNGNIELAHEIEKRLGVEVP